MAEIILLGAGASKEANVCTALEMTKEMIEIVSKSKDPESKTHKKILYLALGGVLFQRGLRGEDPSVGTNIEDLFNAIFLLSRRSELEAAAFIASWHPLVDELDKTTPPSPHLEDLELAIHRSIASAFYNVLSNNKWQSLSAHSSYGSDTSSLEREIERDFRDEEISGGKISALVKSVIKDTLQNLFQNSRFRFGSSDEKLPEIFDQVLKSQPQPGQGEIFTTTAEFMIRQLITMAWIKDEWLVDYLLPLVKYCNERKVVIATLNYDNSIELAARILKIPVGFSLPDYVRFESAQEQDNMNLESNLSLLKLHGSITWERLSAEEIRWSRKLPSSDFLMREVTLEKYSSGMVDYTPAVVFGHRNKLTTEGPFFHLLTRFYQELERSDLLTIIGYSFHDEHVNSLIANWLSADQNRSLRYFNKSFSNCNVTFLKKLDSIKNQVMKEEKITSTIIHELFLPGGIRSTSDGVI